MKTQFSSEEIQCRLSSKDTTLTRTFILWLLHQPNKAQDISWNHQGKKWIRCWRERMTALRRKKMIFSE
jgi:hypothetical protein